jgi:acetoin utilization deacetylase AcuC-like enzyme
MPQPTTGILYDDLFLEHDEPSHPENARRLRAITELLDRSGIRDELRTLTIKPATEQQIGAVHHRRLIEHLQMMAYEGGGWLNPDTYLTGDSWNVAEHAAGAAISAIEAVMGGEVANAFALVRPPGHHATPTKAMGFCLVNNVAVAAQHALDALGVRRIAIVDWDTHHGNGTQDCFYDDGRVLYCSSHTWGIFPGTGDWREMGEGAGAGATLNVPMLPYADDAGFERVYDEVIVPAVARFAPELILVSAGYDSHWADPLAPMNASVAGYAGLAQKVYNLAADVCSGRLVCVLEGGYNLQALAAGVLATLRVLQGRPDLVQDPLGARSGSRADVGPVIDSLRRLHPLLA